MNKKELSYIAGFLDGDGCIMLQIVFRKDYKLGYQIRPSIVFYQKTKNRKFLEWLKNKLKAGYVRNRNDGMSEYAIVGVKPVMKVLIRIVDLVKLKKKQAILALSILKKMPENQKKMTPELLYRLSKEVDKFSLLNYSKKRKITSHQVRNFLKSRHLLIP